MQLTSDVSGVGIDSALPPSVRQGLAFCQLLEAIPAKDLPTAGGASATDRGHDDPRAAHRRSRGPRHLRPRHRRPDHRRRSPTPGLHRRDHPRRPRREVRDPRPRPQATLPLTRPTPRDDAARQGLHRPGMRPSTRRCATPTTTTRGATAATPTSPPGGCSAGTTTGGSTTPTTSTGSNPTGPSASTGGRRARRSSTRPWVSTTGAGAPCSTDEPHPRRSSLSRPGFRRRAPERPAQPTNTHLAGRACRDPGFDDGRWSALLNRRLEKRGSTARCGNALPNQRRRATAPGGRPRTRVRTPLGPR